MKMVLRVRHWQTQPHKRRRRIKGNFKRTISKQLYQWRWWVYVGLAGSEVFFILKYTLWQRQGQGSPLPHLCLFGRANHYMFKLKHSNVPIGLFFSFWLFDWWKWYVFCPSWMWMGWDVWCHFYLKGISNPVSLHTTHLYVCEYFQPSELEISGNNCTSHGNIQIKGK